MGNQCPNCGGYYTGYHNCSGGMGFGGGGGMQMPIYSYPPKYQFIKFDNNTKYYWILDTHTGAIEKREVIDTTKAVDPNKATER